MTTTSHPIATIRKARESEAERLSALAFRSKAHWDYSQEFMDACREELTYRAADLRHNEFFVAEAEGEIVGFYGLVRLSPDEMELEALFVEPTHIGRGFGRALIEHAKTTAVERGASKLVIQGDPNAAKFYRSTGGELTGERESVSIPGRFLPEFIIRLSG